MLYFDTSFLAPLVLPEATSEVVAIFFRERPTGQLTISHWTRVEFASLLAREVRMGGLTAAAAAKAADHFESMVLDSFIVLLPGPADFDLARTFLRGHGTGLRAGDALHLAIARNHRAETVYSLDKTMLRAGKSLGLPTNAGIRVPGYEG